jgi:condensin complex subunit 3
VRKAVLNQIGLSKTTIIEIINRTKDVKDDVRKHAFEMIGKKVNIKLLKISQRAQLLHQGLQDR